MANKNFNSHQEDFWHGEFGDSYIDRNGSTKILASNLNLFSRVLKGTSSVPNTFLEIGANIGLNIKALKQLCPKGKFTAIEINGLACQELRKLGCEVIEDSITNTNLATGYDLVLSKGVLIHLNPDNLLEVYEKIFNWTKKYILIAEYYSPSPVGIVYRGQNDKLFKRDFAGEMLDLYPSLVLVDYGFVYHRDPFPQDDINWFLLEKRMVR